MKTAYLAGPMRGYDEFNFPAFHAAAADLRSSGWRIISPAEMDEAYAFDPKCDPVTPELVRSCVRRDVEALTCVDTIIMLPGWEQSKGATAERAVAQWLGLPVHEYAEIVGSHE